MLVRQCATSLHRAQTRIQSSSMNFLKFSRSLTSISIAPIAIIMEASTCLRHASVRSLACETIFNVFFNTLFGVANMCYFNAQQLAVSLNDCIFVRSGMRFVWLLERITKRHVCKGDWTICLKLSFSTQ